MPTLLTAAQFVAGCLALGLGLFLVTGAARDLHRTKLLSASGPRIVLAMAGLILLLAGAYAARLTVPL